MDSPGSVTRWIMTFRQGDQEAAARLWDRYFQRLTEIARAKLGQTRRAAADEADVALSAFHSFCRCVERGRLTDLRGRDELWRVLVVITKRKAISQLRHEMAAMRGGGKVQSEAFLADVVAQEPTPDFTAELLDEFRHLMELLRDEGGMLGRIAQLKSEGHTNKEIADELSLTTRSIERKLKRICIVWGADAEKRLLGQSP